MSDPRTYLGSWDVVAGDPLSITVNVTADGAPVDLTTYGTAWGADLRQNSLQTPAVVFAVDSTNAATGTLVLSLTGAQTATLTISSGDSTQWLFDLQATGGAVSPQTPFRGQVTAWRPFTHA